MEKKNAMDILHVMKRKKNGSNRRENAKLRSTNKKPPSDALVFLKDSPNYCIRSGKHEFPGTVGRICSIESYGTDSCQDLCCDRGHRSARVTTTHRCKCKFHWCCEIRCDKCTKVEIQHTCKWIRVTLPSNGKTNLEDGRVVRTQMNLQWAVQAHVSWILSSYRNPMKPNLSSVLV